MSEDNIDPENYYTCGYCSMKTDNWELLMSHGCLSDGTAIELDSNNVVILQRDGIHDESNSVDPEQCSDWQQEAVMLLIGKFEDNKVALSKKNTVKKHIWQRIVHEMSLQGYNFTFDQAQNKWKSLIRTYKNIKDDNQETGKNRKHWQFFHVMDSLMAKNPSIDPPIVSHNGLLTKSTAQTNSEVSSDISESDLAGAGPSARLEEPREPRDEDNDSPQTHRPSKKKKLDTNEILLLALAERKKQHEEEMEAKRKFNILFEKLLDKL